MAAFNDFQNILPDPFNTIDSAGGSGGTQIAGEGFASVQLTSEQPVLQDRTNSGRLLARAFVAHKWKIAIRYNPMTQTQFNRIYSFITHRRGGLNPFFVSLPQSRTPQNTTFASYAASNNLRVIGSSAVAAGATSVLIGKNGYSNTTNSIPAVGDLFNISDSNNSNHKKTYMVTRIETTADYQSGTTQPQSDQIRIHFTPGLSKAVSAVGDFVFHNPLIKVITTSNSHQYSLNTDNLYSYSLNLEEVQ